MTKFGDLLDDHIDGELAAEGFDRLCGLLRESDEHCREFAISWLTHSLLHDYMSQRQVQADALLRAIATTSINPRFSALTEDLATPPASTRKPSQAGYEFSRWQILTHLPRLRYVVMGLIAGMLLLLALGSWVHQSLSPKVVAMLTQSANCQWDVSRASIAEGALIYEGDDLSLVRGRAFVTFVNGARMAIDGPTSVRFQSQSAVSLGTGVVAAKVPTQAIGFTVNTKRSRIVDVGTEFLVRAQPDGALELQVFDGMVELTMLDAATGAEDAPLQISEGTAVSVRATARTVKSISYDAEQQILMP